MGKGTLREGTTTNASLSPWHPLTLSEANHYLSPNIHHHERSE